MLSHLSGNEVTILVAAVGILAALFGWFGKGIGFLLKRWLLKDKHRDRLDYISKLADLKIKLRDSGLSIAEIEEVAELF